MAMDSMKGKCATSCVDLGYTNQFCVPEVTSVFFSSCDSVVGDSLEFKQANQAPYVFDWVNAIALDTMQGNRASSPREGKVSCVFSSAHGTFSRTDHILGHTSSLGKFKKLKSFQSSFLTTVH